MKSISSIRITGSVLSANFEKENYELRFYTLQKDPKIRYSLGRFDYQFSKDKELLKVMFFYQNNENSFLYFDRNNPGKFDISLFGRVFRKNLSYYFTFDELKTISMDKIFSLIDDLKLTQELIIDYSDKNLKDNFINKIILPVTGQKYIDDGARNDVGEYVYIATGKKQNPSEQGVNCSGYAKEVVDSYLRYMNPDFNYLKISDLKEKNNDEKMNELFTFYDLKYDIFFGLNWTKNLVNKINILCNYGTNKAKELSNDDYFLFTEIRGFDVSDLKEIIFRDQLKDDTYFYILALNKIRKEKPIIEEFTHISLLVPYFNSNNFYTRFFESGAETSFENIMKNYGNGKVRIFKIPIPIAKL